MILVADFDFGKATGLELLILLKKPTPVIF